MNNIDTCQDLLLSSLTDYYNNNPHNKKILKDIIEGNHKLSLRLIDWLVTHYSKTYNTFYWIHKNTEEIYESYPENMVDSKESKELKKISRMKSVLNFRGKINNQEPPKLKRKRSIFYSCKLIKRYKI
jgi:hypothetical protein